MKKIILFPLMCIHVFMVSAQTFEISGKIISNENHKPIPYSTLFDITTKESGTTTDTNGIFRLVLSHENNKILISSLGYQDTIIIAKELFNRTFIALTRKSVLLKEVIVTPANNVEMFIGKPYAEVRDKYSSASSLGTYFGVYMRSSGNKNKGLIKKVYLYISDKYGFYNAPFSLRVLVPSSKELPNKLKPLSEYADAISKPISFFATKGGWFRINLEAYNVPLTDRGIYLFIIPLKSNNNFKWKFNTNNKDNNYGIAISSYKNYQKFIFPAYLVNDRIGYSSKLRKKIDKDWTPPAIAVEYLN